VGVSDVMLMFADQGERICCTREFQNSIDDSVHEGLKEEIQRLGIEDSFETQAQKILAASGGEMFYKGLARNITSLKSISGVNKLWIEEGESVSERSLKVLTPSIRSTAAANEEGEDPPEIWITMNRGSKDDAIAKKYLARAEEALAACGRYEDDMIMVVEMNYRDNPWFPPELEMERLDDLENLSEAEYMHTWEGHYYDEVDFAIIKQSWFNSAIDSHLIEGKQWEAAGQKVVAYDPADEGKDAKGYALRHGSVFLDIDCKADGDFIDGFDWALDKAIHAQADVFTWDCDGMGIGGKLQVQQKLDGKRITQHTFKGSEGADEPDRYYMPNENDTKQNSKTNKDTFKNKRAQYYVALKDRFFNTYRSVVKGQYVDHDTMISISSTIPKLNEIRAEVCKIPEKPGGSNGRIQILSKEEMRKMEIKSPNMADAMMMAMVSLKPNKKPVVKDVPMVNHFG
jgi:phage terminase large subunit